MGPTQPVMVAGRQEAGQLGLTVDCLSLLGHRGVPRNRILFLKSPCPESWIAQHPLPLDCKAS